LAQTSASGSLHSALPDPTRRAIFGWLVRDGEQTVRSLTEQAGVSQPAVSQHLDPQKTAVLRLHTAGGRLGGGGRTGRALPSPTLNPRWYWAVHRGESTVFPIIQAGQPARWRPQWVVQ
jgi:Helix-turn-helix domain